jgi:hypothetical protein
LRKERRGAIILNCVDDSGGWGRGGFFRALDGVSPLCASSYERAGNMDDLHLGDAHLVPLTTSTSSTPTPNNSSSPTSSTTKPPSLSSSSSSMSLGGEDDTNRSLDPIESKERIHAWFVNIYLMNVRV